MAQNFNVEEPPDANNIDVPENDRLSSAVGQKCFRWLIIGENGREEEDLWKKGFSKISSEVEIEYETSLSSLITAYQEDSVEIEFDLIIIEMDFSAVATVERRCKMALILRLLNYSAPILGLISNADSDQDDMDENKMQGERPLMPSLPFLLCLLIPLPPPPLRTFPALLQHNISQTPHGRHGR